MSICNCSAPLASNNQGVQEGCIKKKITANYLIEPNNKDANHEKKSWLFLMLCIRYIFIFIFIYWHSHTKGSRKKSIALSCITHILFFLFVFYSRCTICVFIYVTCFVQFPLLISLHSLHWSFTFIVRCTSRYMCMWCWDFYPNAFCSTIRTRCKRIL